MKVPDAQTIVTILRLSGMRLHGPPSQASPPRRNGGYKDTHCHQKVAYNAEKLPGSREGKGLHGDSSLPTVSLLLSVLIGKLVEGESCARIILKTDTYLIFFTLAGFLYQANLALRVAQCGNGVLHSRSHLGYVVQRDAII